MRPAHIELTSIALASLASLPCAVGSARPPSLVLESACRAGPSATGTRGGVVVDSAGARRVVSRNIGRRAVPLLRVRCRGISPTERHAG